jgi:hypothetical protein
VEVGMGLGNEKGQMMLEMKGQDQIKSNILSKLDFNNFPSAKNAIKFSQRDTVLDHSVLGHRRMGSLMDGEEREKTMDTLVSRVEVLEQDLAIRDEQLSLLKEENLNYRQKNQKWIKKLDQEIETNAETVQNLQT